MEADIRLDRGPAEMPIEDCLRGLEPNALVLAVQELAQALAAADQVYCLQEGRVAFAGAAESATRAAVAAAYFGI